METNTDNEVKSVGATENISVPENENINDGNQEVNAENTKEESKETNESSEQSPEVNKAFAGVKKEYREKGFKDGLNHGWQEGYRKAQEELSQKIASSAPTTPQYSSPQQPHASMPPSQNEAYINHFEQRARNIELEGCREIEDFSEKIGNLRARADREASYGNNDLLRLMANAVEVGDHKTIYELANSADTLNKLLDRNPSKWVEDLRKIGKKENVVVIKNAAPPLKDINATPVNNTKVSLSDSEKRRKVRNMKW